MSNEVEIKTETKELSALDVKEAVKMDQNAPEDVAAAFFALEYPRFRAMLGELSHNELVRVCLNLAGNEFVPDANKVKSDKEKSAFFLGNEMVFNRAIMRLSFEMQKAEEAQKRLDEQEALKQQETNTISSTEGEQSNG